MKDELLTEDQKRLHILRTGVHVLHAMLVEAFEKPYNLIVIACPAGEQTVSLMSRCESEEAMKGMATVLVRSIDGEQPGDVKKGEVLQ